MTIEPLAYDQYTREDADLACRVMQKSPETLTDRHVAILLAEDKAWGDRSMGFGRRALRLREDALQKRAEAQSAAALAADRQKTATTATSDERHKRRLKAFDDWVKAFNDLADARDDDAATQDPWKRLTHIAANAKAELLLPIVGFLAAVNRNNWTRNKQIASLEARVAALEAQPKGVNYCGVWQRAMVYEKNQGVTWDGSYWVCLKDGTQSQPNMDLKSWQLAVRHGQDKS